MNNLKRIKFFRSGRKWFFTLALFVLVFAVANAVKIQAAGNIGGWLWGGSEDCDLDSNGFQDAVCGGDNATTGLELNYSDAIIGGNETGVGWISMNNRECDLDKNGFVDAGDCEGDNTTTGTIPYGVIIPKVDGPIIGTDNFGWSKNIGWVSFNAGDLDGCPAPPCNARREGNGLAGWARIMGIKTEFEKVPSNSAGWLGWIKLASTSGDPIDYGVTIDPISGKFSGQAWSEELGWIDFSRAGFPALPGCATKTRCVAGDDSAFTSCDDSFCTNRSTCQLTADTTWNCQNIVDEVKPCSAVILNPDDGECNEATTKTHFCEKIAPATADLCTRGTPSPVSTGYSEYSWTCGSTTCGGHPVNCSALGNHCGWIESNP